MEKEIDERLKKLEKKNTTSSIVNICLSILAIGVFVYLLFTGIMSFFPSDSKEDTIKFEVVGIVNSTNATTLIEIHYECIRYCISAMSDGTSSQYRCLDECASLGKEGCQ